MSRGIAPDLRATIIVVRIEERTETKSGADTNYNGASETRHQFRDGHVECRGE